MKRAKFFFRITLLVLLLGVFLLGATARLYNLQITHGADNLREAERRLRRTVALPAARGEILDRYGRPLVVNRLSYSVRLDLNRLTQADDPAGTLNRLVELMDEARTAYADTFPVVGPPFVYRADLTEQDDDRLREFFQRKKWEPLDAEALMARMREEYAVDDRFSDAEALRIVGIRYELDLRALFGMEPYRYIAPYRFADDVDITLVGKIREQGLPGVTIDNVPIREYRTEFAAHLLGRVGQIPEEESEDYKTRGYAADEIVGLDGLERTLESWLRGKDGVREEETTASGKVTNIVSARAPEPGKNCMLTIDIRFQEQVEYALASGIEALRERGRRERLAEEELAGGGAAVVIDVSTGEVLSMASFPTFRLIDFLDDYAALNEDPMQPMFNRALAGAYEPGSTFKMAVSIAALESGAIAPGTRITDRGRYMRFAPSYTPRCSGGHGSVNVSRALQVSCNYFFYDVGWMTGIETMNRYARSLGFGEVTGIELPAERAGSLAGPAYCAQQGIPWNGGDVLQAAIGQSYNQFTPLQLASYTATIANNGVRCRPHLLGTVKSYDYDETLYDTPVEVVADMDLKPETLQAVHEGMRLVTQPGGTAAGTFASYRIPVGAKTGSAQKKADGSPDNGVFVSYAPFDKPEIAVAVVVERGGGGARVAPIARDIFDAYFNGQNEMDSISAQNALRG
ncbi:MAG: penicillin-binding protein [Oscillospiraceae bacterium]|jgi:penicillin-binding protein 2|nr:penicillin-binding protein [Oscillospiraceae bacterium]